MISDENIKVYLTKIFLIKTFPINVFMRVQSADVKKIISAFFADYIYTVNVRIFSLICHLRRRARTQLCDHIITSLEIDYQLVNFIWNKVRFGSYFVNTRSNKLVDDDVI